MKRRFLSNHSLPTIVRTFSGSSMPSRWSNCPKVQAQSSGEFPQLSVVVRFSTVSPVAGITFNCPLRVTQCRGVIPYSLSGTDKLAGVKCSTGTLWSLLYFAAQCKGVLPSVSVTSKRPSCIAFKGHRFSQLAAHLQGFCFIFLVFILLMCLFPSNQETLRFQVVIDSIFVGCI